MPLKAISNPPRAGPVTDPNELSAEFVVSERVNSLAGTTDGRMACRAGNSNDDARLVTSTTPYNSPSETVSVAIAASTAIEASPGTSCDASSTTRRSYASTTAPPMKLLSSADMNAIKPTRPSDSADPEIAY